VRKVRKELVTFRTIVLGYKSTTNIREQDSDFGLTLMQFLAILRVLPQQIVGPRNFAHTKEAVAEEFESNDLARKYKSASILDCFYDR
jgi:hypothetical protein